MLIHPSQQFCFFKELLEWFAKLKALHLTDSFLFLQLHSSLVLWFKLWLKAFGYLHLIFYCLDQDWIKGSLIALLDFEWWKLSFLSIQVGSLSLYQLHQHRFYQISVPLLLQERLQLMSSLLRFNQQSILFLLL